MRGALIDKGLAVGRLRIIPAYAGSTHQNLSFQITSTGSSPRMRGAQVQGRVPLQGQGIIPAYAGSTALVVLRRHELQDHPRVCGEHTRTRCLGCARRGSSPRMRGAQRARVNPQALPGIIPAYAGSTSQSRGCRACTSDHPRVCGEHGPATSRAPRSAGSSPRMRGAREVHDLLVGQVGIIPAYAGSTWPRRTGAGRHWDHPRVCGEHRVLSD